jgi:hypothetical protein
MFYRQFTLGLAIPSISFMKNRMTVLILLIFLAGCNTPESIEQSRDKTLAEANQNENVMEDDLSED